MNIWGRIRKNNINLSKKKKNERPIRRTVEQLFPRSFIVGADEGGRDSTPHIVVFLNGARGRGEWYPRVAQSMENTFHGNRIVVREIDYPRVSTLGTIYAAATGKLPIDIGIIARDIKAVQTEYGVTRVSIIAHSLGTFVLQKLFEETNVNFKNIILAGSIIDSNFPWDRYRRRYVSVVNDCGQRDVLCRLAGLTCHFGNSGRFGFRNPLVIDRYFKDAGHSTFTSGNFDYALWTRIIVRGEIEFPINSVKFDGNFITRFVFNILNMLRFGCRNREVNF